MAPSDKPFRGILAPVARRLHLPFSTPEFLDKIIRGGVNQAGRRTLQMLITTWDAAGGRPVRRQCDRDRRLGQNG